MSDATNGARDGLITSAITQNSSSQLSDMNGQVNAAQHPSQQAEPERELGSLCSSLQAAAAAANNDLREYLLAHSNQRASIVPLSSEFVGFQTIARLYIRRCSVVGIGADDSNDQNMPRPLLQRLVTIVHQSGQLISDAMTLLETSSGGGVGRARETLSAEQLATRVSQVTATAKICTAALNLGLDAMALGPALQSVAGAANTTVLPAYETTQLLEDTLSLRLQISNLNPQEASELPDVLLSVSEFLDHLQGQMGESSSSLLVPRITESNAEPTDSRPDSASSRPDLLQSSGLLQPGANEAALSGQQSPAYDSVRVDHPAPASISLQHVSRKPFMEGEILSVAFISKNGETFVTANNMMAPTKFYPVVGSIGQFAASYSGGRVVFPPEDAGSTAWAYVTEDEPAGSSSGGASPWQHDGSDFRKPVLCVGDFTTSKRHQKVRQWGIRPLCFSRDGAQLAVTNGWHRIALLDAAHQFSLRPDAALLTSHTEAVTHAMFTPDSHALVSLSRDGTVRLIDPLSMEPLAKLDTGTWKTPALLGVTPDSNVVVSVWGDVVYRWNHTTGAVDSFTLGARRIREGWPVALSPDCRFLLCRNDEGVDISDAHSGKLLFTVHFSRGFLTAAAFSADGKFLALGKASSWVGPKVVQSTLDIWRLEF